MSTIIRGSTDIVEGAATYSSDPNGSGTTTRTFAGSQTAIVQLASQMQAQGYATQIDQDTPWKMTATLAINKAEGEGTEEPEPESTWQISPLTGEANIMESGLKFIKELPISTKEIILYNAKNPRARLPLFPSSKGVTQEMFTDATVLETLMKCGVNSVRINTISLSRTIQVSRKYVNRWDIANVNKVFSKGALVSQYNIPQWVQVLMPESREDTIQNQVIIAKDSSIKIECYWGYMMEHPTYQSIADNKVQISQDWHFNQWAKPLYNIIG